MLTVSATCRYAVSLWYFDSSVMQERQDTMEKALMAARTSTWEDSYEFYAAMAKEDPTNTNTGKSLVDAALKAGKIGQAVEAGSNPKP